MRLESSQLPILILSFASATYAIPNLASSFLVQSYFAYDSLSANILSLSTVPPDFDFWKSAEDLGDKATNYADKTIKEEFVKYSVPLEKIDEFKEGMKDLINNTSALQIPEDKQTEGNFNFNVTEFNQMLSAEIDVAMQGLMEELREPLPEDQTERGQKREEIVIKALDMIEDALVRVYGHWEVPEIDAREKFSHVRPNIRHVVLIVGNITDEHPDVLDIVLFTAAIMIIPESLFLEPLLRVFGFGPEGVIKGSSAAWAQGFFYRGTTEAESWFSGLQYAGTTGDPKELGFWWKVLFILEQAVLDFFKAFFKALLTGRKKRRF